MGGMNRAGGLPFWRENSKSTKHHPLMPPPKKKGISTNTSYVLFFLGGGVASKKGIEGWYTFRFPWYKSRTNLVLFYVFFWLDPKSPQQNKSAAPIWKPPLVLAASRDRGAGNRLLETSGAKGREVWRGLATGLSQVEAKLMEGLFNTHFDCFWKICSLSKTAG